MGTSQVYTMGSATSIMVANAFKQDVWVKVDSVLIEECSASNKMSVDAKLQAGVCNVLPKVGLDAAVGFNSEKEKKAIFNKFMDIGFTKMSRGNVTTFKPAQNSDSEDMKVIYVTIGYYDEDGKEKYLAKNSVHEKSYNVIITESGGIVDSYSRSYPWIDLNGMQHYCKTCLSQRSTCTICLVNHNLEEIQKSITAVQTEDVAHSLTMALDTISIKKIQKEEADALEVIEDVKKLASKYRDLQAETKRSVQKVRLYGENLKEAAEDYVEDGDTTELLHEVKDVRMIKESIEKCNTHHNNIKGQVTDIQKRVNKHTSSLHGKVLDKLEQAKKSRLPGKHMLEEWLDTLSENGKKLAKEIAEVAVHIPGQGTLGKAIVACLSGLDAKHLMLVLEEFQTIEQKMQSVDEHLTKITSHIDDIENNLDKAIKAEEKLIRKHNKKDNKSTEKEEREKEVQSLVLRAEELMKSCDKYFQLVRNGEISEAIEDFHLQGLEEMD